MISAAVIWMEMDAQRRAAGRRVAERRVTERRAPSRQRKMEIVRRPAQEAKNGGIISKCGHWLLKKLGLKKTQSD